VVYVAASLLCIDSARSEKLIFISLSYIRTTAARPKITRGRALLHNWLETGRLSPLFLSASLTIQVDLDRLEAMEKITKHVDVPVCVLFTRRRVFYLLLPDYHSKAMLTCFGAPVRA
jgi:hypothetical protein